MNAQRASNNINGQHNPTKPLIFDPYTITPDHESHLQSTSTIRIQRTGRIICPLCLQSLSLDKLKEIDIDVFNQYVTDLFEGLNQHPEAVQFRKVALTVLEIILARRSIDIYSDDQLNGLLAIIRRVKKNFRFSRFEFIQVAKIFSSVTASFCNSNNYIPFLSLWNCSSDLLDYARAQLIHSPSEWLNIPHIESLRFLETVATIVKTYFDLMGKYALDDVSDLIFPQILDKTFYGQQRKVYTKIQENCLEFIRDHLLPSCWQWLTSFNTTPIPQELCTIREILATVGSSFLVAKGMTNQSFLKYLTTIDILKIANGVLHLSSEASFKAPIREFIRNYIKHYAEEEFGCDEILTTITKSGDIVETSSQKVLIYLSQNSKHLKILFYLVYNAIAYRQKSKYFDVVSLISVLKLLEPQNMNLSKSRAMMRVYILLVSVVNPNIETNENAHKFLTETWQNAPLLTTLNEQFCFDEQVFTWATKYPEFLRLIRMPSLSYMVKRAISKGDLIFFLARVFQDPSLRKIVLNYFEVSKSSVESINEIIRFEEAMDNLEAEVGRPQHLLIVNELSAILPNLLHKIVLKIFADPGKDLLKNRALRLTNMIVMMMDSIIEFKLVLSEQFLFDLFRVLANIYEKPLCDHDVGLLIAMNELFTRLIRTNNSNLMTMFRHMDHYVMGYMFHHLADYKKSDELAESIAKLLVAYDYCDYPLIQDLTMKLYPMAPSALNWMLSPNEDLHILALRLCQKILGTDHRTKTRNCLSTGLMHILNRESRIFSDYTNMTILMNLVLLDEFVYHPMRPHIMDKLPPQVRYEFELQINLSNVDPTFVPEREASPSFSFTTIDSGRFEEEQATIRSLIPRLYDEDDNNVSSFRQSGSRFTQDEEPLSAEVDHWENYVNQSDDTQPAKT